MASLNISNRIREIEEQLAQLPTGTVVYKQINGKRQPYLQWAEGGKTRSKYLKALERETVIAQVEKRKALAEELKRLRMEEATQPAQSQEEPYRTRIIVGNEIERIIGGVKGFQRRDCFGKLQRYVLGESYGKVCLLYGLRRTGKTTLLFQSMAEMTDEERSKAVYIKARVTDTMADMNHDLKLMSERGYRYIYIDEVTLLRDFIDSAALFSDVFAMQGIKIVLSGTDSLGFWLTMTNELYDRAYTIHTTYIPFREYRRLLGINDIDTYIRYGGTLRMGEIAFDDEDALEEGAPFRDDETTRRYIDTAICKNIQHSLACCERGNYLRHLRTLFDAGELTGAINRIIESMNHQFLLKTLVQRFKSHDLGSAAEVLRKQPDDAQRTDILDRIDREAITSKLMEMLEIRNIEDQKIGITATHVAEIKEYLKALDLVVDCPSETTSTGAESSEYVLFTQPGMRYCQAQALVHVLMKDTQFASYSEREKNLACERILEEVRGRMMEDIVLLETVRSLPKNKRAFKLTLSRSEIDMLIYSSGTNSCEAFEIKHSREIVPRQYHVLEDVEQCSAVEKKYGQIIKRCILFRGDSCMLDNGIQYQNVEEYLNNL